ncbi:MAG TPA: sensor histidine kinase [Nitrososphaeraceae archaeon]|nr:sensor histidine kinase [Nitrososphaeraceae archaeon]
MKSPKRFIEIGIVSIVLIVSLSYGLYFFLQGVTENSIKENLFEEQRLRQIDKNNAISQHIATDIDSILSRLKVVANSAYVQEGNLTSSKIQQLLQDMYSENKELVGEADNFFVGDKNGIIKLVASDNEFHRSLVGADVSLTDYANRTRSTLKPVFSNGTSSPDGIYRIIVATPILDSETGEYRGLVGAGIPTVEFFERFGNVYDIKSEYLAALDRNATQLVHSNPRLIGEDFFGDYTQNFTRHNEGLNNLMKRVLSGEPGDVLYTIGLGERLTTGFPISISGEGHTTGVPPYVVFIVTPTLQIYSQIENILFSQRVETFSLLAISTAAAIILIVFLIRWSRNLDAEVKRRTRELESAYEQLKGHERMQQDFINIAAHELRTPTQSIVGYTELLEHDYNLIKESLGDRDLGTQDSLDALKRNVIRLKNLTNNILDVSRIEAGTLKLNMESINLNEKVRNVLKDITNTNPQVAEKGLTVQFLNDKKNHDINTEYYVYADKSRIFQLLSNLINNAIKFTDSNGIISVSLSKASSCDNNDTAKEKEYVCIRIRDNGRGIDPAIQPRLFSKFATKSDIGTGLGLFIAKSIVEAHGGKIRGENNPGDRGATFTFTLPLEK